MKCSYFPKGLVVALESALPFNKNFIKRHWRFNRGCRAATLRGAFQKNPPVGGSPFTQWLRYSARNGAWQAKKKKTLHRSIGGFTDHAAQGHRRNQVCWRRWGESQHVYSTLLRKSQLCPVFSGDAQPVVSKGRWMTPILTPTDPSREKNDHLYRKERRSWLVTESYGKFATLPWVAIEYKSKDWCLKGFFSNKGWLGCKCCKIWGQFPVLESEALY